MAIQKLNKTQRQLLDEAIRSNGISIVGKTERRQAILIELWKNDYLEDDGRTWIVTRKGHDAIKEALAQS